MVYHSIFRFFKFVDIGFQLLIWHFFVLTQKSTHAKGIPLGEKVKTKRCFSPHPIAPSPFCQASALKFQNKIFSTGFSLFVTKIPISIHLNWQVAGCDLSYTHFKRSDDCGNYFCFSASAIAFSASGAIILYPSRFGCTPSYPNSFFKPLRSSTIAEK